MIGDELIAVVEGAHHYLKVKPFTSAFNELIQTS